MAAARSALHERRNSRNGEALSAERRVSECLAAIAALNPRLGAFIQVDAEGALAAARASDARRRDGLSLGVLDGMPLAIKDNIDVAGLRAAAGLQARRQRLAVHDADCIARLRRQGAVFLGKTLMDEAALSALGDNPWFGRCHNPVRQGYTAGGSSSGSAAAVAAGLCPAALGTDTLGSVRIPASYCGVVGYLPARGSIDAAGVAPLMPEFDRVGVFARSVADAARVAAAMAERAAPQASPGDASIGLIRGLEGFVAPAIAAAAEQAAATLAAAGNRLVEIRSPPLDWAGLRRAAFLLIEVEAAHLYGTLLDDGQSGLSPALRAALDYGRRAAPDRVARARGIVQAARLGLEGMLSECDLLLLPATPQTAFSFDAPTPDTQADLAAPASIAGLAAISVPAGFSGGLPMGVQLVGHDDARLLAAASRLA